VDDTSIRVAMDGTPFRFAGFGGSVDRDSHTERRRSIVNEPDDTITL